VSCRELADLLELSFPHESDPTYYLRLACSYGDAEGCWRAAGPTLDAGDPAREASLRSQACRLDSYYCRLKSYEAPEL
jgi:hypothetical protein